MYRAYITTGDGYVTGDADLTARTLSGAKRQLGAKFWLPDHNGQTVVIEHDKTAVARGTVRHHRVTDWVVA